MKIHNLHKVKEYRKKLRKNATPQEVVLWSRLRRSELGYKFRRQHSIGPYIVDFYCPTKSLVIELDGSGHKNESSIAYDRQRTMYLEELGFCVLRFDNTEVDNNISNVVLHIEEHLKQ